MQCPKCKAENPDGSAFCTLCNHFFKPRRIAPPKRRLLRSVDAEIDGWQFHGPLIIDTDGFYFFVKLARYEPSFAAKVATRFAGSVGGTVAGLAAEKALEASSEGRARPPHLKFGSRSDVDYIYGEHLTTAPEIAECIDYFFIPRTVMTRLILRSEEELTIWSLEFVMELSGGFGAPEVSGQLALWSYPLDPERSNVRKFSGAALAAFAGALALVSWDFFESKSGVTGALHALKNFLFGPNGVMYTFEGYYTVIGVVIGGVTVVVIVLVIKTEYDKGRGS